MGLKPQKHGKYDCLTLNSRTNSTVVDGSDDLADTFEDNCGFKKVYINFDYETEYKAIIYEGDFKDKECPYKRMLCYPYEEQVFKVGQYISFYDDYGNENVMLLDAIDMQERDSVIAHIYKCNNMLKWYDGYGILHEYPCVFNIPNSIGGFDFNMNVDVVNGTSKVKVQYNEFTKLFKDNQRFIFNGKAMITTGVYNHYQSDIFDSDTCGVITISMMRDTIANDDDIINNIANINKYKYTIAINPREVNVQVGDTGTLSCSVILNGAVVSEEVIWLSEDENIVTIDENGNYECITDGTSKISCMMKNNENIIDEIIMTVSSVVFGDVKIVVEPNINKILQGRSQAFTCKKFIDGVDSGESLTIIDTSTMSSDFYKLSILNNEFTITNLKQNSKDKVKVNVSDSNGNEINLEYALGGLW